MTLSSSKKIINLYREAYWEEWEGAKGPLSRALQAPKGSQALRRSEKEGATLTFSFKYIPLDK